jgi:hydrogenase nickel incorporation protein HypA/HybF
VHELTIASAIVQVAANHGNGGAVLEVLVEVGELAGVSPDALQFAWDVAAAGTPCEGARLVVRLVAVAVRCPSCGTEGELAEPLRLRCRACGTPTGDVIRGRELHVVQLTLAPEVGHAAHR